MRIYLFIIFVGLFVVSDFYGNVRDYLNYSEDLEHVTDPQGGFAFLMAMDAESCKEDAFTFLAVELPLYTLLVGICIYFTTVLAQGNKSGWNRYLRTLPITPVMRAKSMLWSRGVIFVICTLCVTAFSGAFSWVVFGKDIALKAIPAALITSLIVETSDLLVNSIVVRWVLTADKKYSDNISFTAGLFPMLFLSLGLGMPRPYRLGRLPDRVLIQLPMDHLPSGTRSDQYHRMSDPGEKLQKVLRIKPVTAGNNARHGRGICCGGRPWFL